MFKKFFLYLQHTLTGPAPAGAALLAGPPASVLNTDPQKRSATLFKMSGSNEFLMIKKSFLQEVGPTTAVEAGVLPPEMR